MIKRMVGRELECNDTPENLLFGTFAPSGVTLMGSGTELRQAGCFAGKDSGYGSGLIILEAK